nr:hypothetical protein [Chloroflexota bacterium]
EQDDTAVEAELPATQAEVAPLTQEEPAQPDTQVAIEPEEEEITLPATQLASEPVEEFAIEQEATPVEADLPGTQAEVSESAEELTSEQETAPSEADLPDTQAEVAESGEEPAPTDKASEEALLVESEPDPDTEEDTLFVPAILMPTAEPVAATDASQEVMPSLEAPPMQDQAEAMELDVPAAEIPVADLSTTTSAEPQEETTTGESLPEADATTAEAVTAPGEPGAVTFVDVANDDPTMGPPLQEYVEPEQNATTGVIEQEQEPGARTEPSHQQRATAIENADTTSETPAYAWQPQESPPVTIVPKKRRNFLQRLLAALFGR